MKGDIMNELMEMYAGVAKVSAEKEKVKLQRDMAKTFNASQMTDSFMDFYDRILAKTPDVSLQSALDDYKEILNALR